MRWLLGDVVLTSGPLAFPQLDLLDLSGRGAREFPGRDALWRFESREAMLTRIEKEELQLPVVSGKKEIPDEWSAAAKEIAEHMHMVQSLTTQPHLRYDLYSKPRPSALTTAGRRNPYPRRIRPVQLDDY